MPGRRATVRVDQYKEVRAALAEANAGDFASPRAINAVARKWRVTARAKPKKFQKDLLASTRQMRRGQAGRVTKVKLPAAEEARASVGLS